MSRNKLMVVLLGSVMVFSLVFGAAATYAQAGDLDGSDLVLAHHGGGRGGFAGDGEALAEALGITVAELEAAQLEARNAMIDQAVEDGYLTEAQAEVLKDESLGGVRHFPRSPYDNSEYLAEALGITVEELDAARQQVMADRLATAVEAGLLTQEQADMMLARQAVRSYFDREGLQAQAQATAEAAIADALADGAITQEQADALLEQLEARPFGFGGFSGPGGRGGHHGRGPGGFGGFGGFDFTPGTSAPETGGITGQDA